MLLIWCGCTDIGNWTTSFRKILPEKSRAGHTDKVRELLEKHGTPKLSEIDPSEYPALLAEAEVLGNE